MIPIVPLPDQFTTARLLLRSPSDEDIEKYYKTVSSCAVATLYMAWPRARSSQDTHAFNATARKQRSEASAFFYVICLRDEQERIIGSCGIGADSNDRSFAWNGGYILAKEYWGRGYATEAYTPLVLWAQSQPSIFRVWANRHVDNHASGRVLEKCGLSKEAVLKRETVFPNISDEPQDAVIYAWARP